MTTTTVPILHHARCAECGKKLKRMAGSNNIYGGFCNNPDCSAMPASGPVSAGHLSLVYKRPEQPARSQCPVCHGFLPDDHNGGEFACPKCGTEFG